ncbi:glycoside hydrolase family 13 protein [Pseudarthrobacter sp. J75]|uniref:glycoside hydrolase family 13 protein n=1 Tax=unclassified Pseudarthrobacter TaxID=2647000 RepID=UPI002E817A1F|nr:MULTISPECIES: glycoside hydrolase family 13 protein [unclassified Pseudarthrobacter]MEE2523158.1 glycoside hydrolase family 13 protein [Pseudarthrobacter sp. J47]MEE2527413.1 glycoside hydrolase family 13 protein [Pseudarthrobacter sp. J75]
MSVANYLEAALTAGPLTEIHPADHTPGWWRSAVIYQIYPRSFRDANGDGVGDLAGITAELSKLAELDIDAVWLSPFYRSPQRDAGYDVSDYCDVDPLFGTLADFDAMQAEAERLGLRVIVDLVPNHCSDQHVAFQAALLAAPGSPERDMFIFRDGKGATGELPPNNWQSHFGGPAWTRITEPNGTPGQWFLHLFDSSQPDFNWDNPAVHAEFERVLRFWLDRGVAGFRVDVAHALVKAPGLPEWGGRPDGNSSYGFPGSAAPMFGQPALHDIYRAWRKILAEYGPDRILCAEANVDPLPRLADWVRPDEMHQAFNFPYLHAGSDVNRLRTVVTDSLIALDAVGAPSTWVLSNHDVVRHATRFGYNGPAPRDGDGIGPSDPQPDAELGRTRAAAASLFMLGLPGGAYLYQGEELGLPDGIDIPADRRQDPTFARTGGERLGRDGCRVPLPWTSAAPHLGFGSDAEPWLPQPDSFAALARDLQTQDPASHLNLYRTALSLRRTLALGTGSLAWAEDWCTDSALAYVNGTTLVVMNLGSESLELPTGLTLLQNSTAAGRETPSGLDGFVAPNQTVWLQLDPA